MFFDGFLGSDDFELIFGEMDQRLIITKKVSVSRFNMRKGSSLEFGRINKKNKYLRTYRIAASKNADKQLSERSRENF